MLKERDMKEAAEKALLKASQFFLFEENNNYSGEKEKEKIEEESKSRRTNNKNKFENNMILIKKIPNFDYRRSCGVMDNIKNDEEKSNETIDEENEKTVDYVLEKFNDSSKKLNNSKIFIVNEKTEKNYNKDLEQKTYECIFIDNNNENIQNSEITYKKYIDSEKEYYSNFYEEQTNKKISILKNDYILTNFNKKEKTIIDETKDPGENDIKRSIFDFKNIINDTYDKFINEFPKCFEDIDKDYKEQIYNQLIQNYNSISREFINNYSINPNLNNLESIYKDFPRFNEILTGFNYIRYIKDDNNDSFYRGFMYGLIERYIINQNITKLSILFLDILKLYDLYPSIYLENNIDMKYILTIFNIIYEYGQISLWDEIYKIFISCYNNSIDKSNDFDKVLIIYLHYTIFFFYISMDVQNFDNSNKKDLFKKVHPQTFLMNKFDPTNYVFEALPYIFDIKLSILFVDNTTKNYNKIYTNECSNNKEILFMIFLYNSYHIIYNEGKVNNIAKINMNKFSPVNYQIMKDEYICEKCSFQKEGDIKMCDEKILKKDNKNHLYYFCKECLKTNIENHLKIRLEKLHGENYINYLYYLKPISITITSDSRNQQKQIFSNLDMISIYKISFNEIIHKIMSKKCLKCFKENNILKKYNCGCNFCKDCTLLLLEKYKNMLNPVTFPFTNENSGMLFCPFCKSEIDLEKEDLTIFKINLESICKNNKNNLENKVKDYCFNCTVQKLGFDIKSKNASKNDYQLFLVETPSKNLIGKKLIENIHYFNTFHLLCYDCYKIKENKIKNTLQLINNQEYYNIQCNICGVSHLIKKDYFKFERKDVISCSCNIY